MKNRREFIREQADWRADIYADETIYSAPVRNLSLGGIELIRPVLWMPKPNHLCKISLSDMVPSHTLEIRMEVCWATEKSIGLKYHELKFRDRIKLNKILSYLANNAALEDAHFVM